ncbi:hypothetical protein ACFX1Z_029617 [Malus domestica]
MMTMGMKAQKMQQHMRQLLPLLCFGGGEEGGDWVSAVVVQVQVGPVDVGLDISAVSGARLLHARLLSPRDV